MLEEGTVKRLFYVPVTISMIWNAIQDLDECKVDNCDAKSVLLIIKLQVTIVGRITKQVYRDPGEIHYTLNDNTAAIAVIDYNGEEQDFLKVKEG